MNEFFANTAQPASVAADEAIRLLDRYEQRQPGTVIQFGFPGLDDKISMLAGNYYLIAARPGTGKTAFMMQLVGTVLRQLPQDWAILVFSAEMDRGSLTLREACGRAGVGYWDMLNGRLTKEEYATVRQIADTSRHRPVYTDSSGMPTLEHMAAQAYAIERTGKKLGLILMDYLQLAGEVDVNEKQRVDKISKGMAALAKQFDCPVLALGQTNRQMEPGKPLGLHNLMYGGEQQPSGVIILDRPWLADKAYHRNQVDVYIAKHRHGPSGNTTLYYQPETMTFWQAEMQHVPLQEDGWREV